MGRLVHITSGDDSIGDDSIGAHSGGGSRVVDVETGELITGVRNIVVRIPLNDVVSADIDILPSKVTLKNVDGSLRTIKTTELENENTELSYQNRALKKEINSFRTIEKIAFPSEKKCKLNWFKKIIWNLLFKEK